MTLAESVHELLKLGATLDFEEHLIVVVGNFDVQVLRAAGVGIGTLASRAAVVVMVRHCDKLRGVVCRRVKSEWSLRLGVLRTSDVDLREEICLANAVDSWQARPRN